MIHAPHIQFGIRKPMGKKRRDVGNHKLAPWNNFPMTLDTRRGRVWWSERRAFPLDRLSSLLSFFSEQLEEPPASGFPVPVGTAGDITFEVDVGLRALDDEILVLVPLSLPPPEEAASLAMGPPGKTYWALVS